jgi:cytochrome bd-type quinol oxidase subunit 2
MSLFSLLAQEGGKDLGGFQGFEGSYTPEIISGSDPSLGDSGLKITELISNVLGFFTITAGLAFLIYFAIGGLTWITAGGDKGKIDEAKSRMTGGAIGMIVIVSSYAIAWIVGTTLGIDLLNPAEELTKLGPGL